MSQPAAGDSDVDATPSGLTLRTEFNDIIAAILTKYSGATEPSVTFQYMNWLDTSQSPPEWKIRNAADSAWIKLAEVDISDIKVFSEGAAVVGLANTSSFTEPQTIDKSSAAGSLTIKSDRTTGIAASVDMGGHDDGANDTIYGSIDLEITDDTDGSEDGQMVFRIIQAGSDVARMTVGATVSVTGTLNATTVQQGGTSLAAIIEAEIDSVDLTNGTTATTRTIPTNTTAGDITRFTGAGASTWTINSGTASKVYSVLNDGTADITFVAGSGVTVVGGLNLGQQKLCHVIYITSTRVFIRGENT